MSCTPLTITGMPHIAGLIYFDIVQIELSKAICLLTNLFLFDI